VNAEWAGELGVSLTRRRRRLSGRSGVSACSRAWRCAASPRPRCAGTLSVHARTRNRSPRRGARTNPQSARAGARSATRPTQPRVVRPAPGCTQDCLEFRANVLGSVPHRDLLARGRCHGKRREWSRTWPHGSHTAWRPVQIPGPPGGSMGGRAWEPSRRAAASGPRFTRGGRRWSVRDTAPTCARWPSR